MKKIVTLAPRKAVYGWITGMHRGSVAYIGGKDFLPAPFTKEEEEREVLKAGSGDEFARAQLVEHNLRLVVFIAKKFENTGLSIEDLISIGAIGLIKAVNSFKSDKQIKLATYASRCIENEILMVLRRTNRMKMEVSFDEPLNTDWDGNELLLSDIMGTEADLVSHDLEAEEERKALYKAIGHLKPREKRIIDLRYGMQDGNERTQKEVADMMGISQSYISRLEKKIIDKLQRDMAKLA